MHSPQDDSVFYLLFSKILPNIYHIPQCRLVTRTIIKLMNITVKRNLKIVFIFKREQRVRINYNLVLLHTWRNRILLGKPKLMLGMRIPLGLLIGINTNILCFISLLRQWSN